MEYPSSDPALLAKFKCHPTVPCDIPRDWRDIDALWHHISDDLLPKNWSSNWRNFSCSHWRLPNLYDMYSMGKLDTVLKANYGIQYPIKGVMYCTAEWLEPGGLFEQQLPPGNSECFVFQDALGEYYFYYEFSQGGDEYLAKFRAPRGTTISDFLKHHFRGAVKGTDMDLILPEETDYYYTLRKEQKELAELHKQARVQLHCACVQQGSTQEAKLKFLRLVE